MLIITVQIFSLCQHIFPCVRTKFPVFSLSGKSMNQIPCFPVPWPPCSFTRHLQSDTPVVTKILTWVIYDFYLGGKKTCQGITREIKAVDMRIK